MLEGIRRLLMTRFQIRLEFYEKFEGNICPKIVKKLEKTSENARNCFALYAGNQVFEVEHNSKSYIVDIGLKSCSCRKWDLRGIPCCHGVSAILADKGHPEDYLDKFYQNDTFYKAYNQIIYPIPDITTWKSTEGYVILPPQVRVAPGRPKKARKRGPDELKNPNTVRKYGAAIKCGKCQQEGHNLRTCKVVLNSSKVKTKAKPTARRVFKQSSKEAPGTKKSGPSTKLPRYVGATCNANVGQGMRSVSANTLNYVADKNKLHSKTVRVGDAVFTTKVASNAIPSFFGNQSSRVSKSNSNTSKFPSQGSSSNNI